MHHLEAFGVADGLIEDGALVVVDLEGNAEGGEGSEDIGEENDAVGLERAPGLKGDLGDQVGGLGALAEGGVLHREVAVLLHVATSLTHHPGGGALDGEALGGANQERVLSVVGGANGHGDRAGLDGAGERLGHDTRAGDVRSARRDGAGHAGGGDGDGGHLRQGEGTREDAKALRVEGTERGDRIRGIRRASPRLVDVTSTRGGARDCTFFGWVERGEIGQSDASSEISEIRDPLFDRHARAIDRNPSVKASTRRKGSRRFRRSTRWSSARTEHARAPLGPTRKCASVPP